MPKLTARHQRQNIFEYNDFSGGLNFLVSPDQIANNELYRADNVEYDYRTGAITKCSGLSEVFDAEVPIASIFILSFNLALFSSRTNLYSTNFITKTLIGTLNSTLKPTYREFGYETINGVNYPVVVISSGGKLQKYVNGTLTTINTSPDNCTHIFVKDGRINVICKQSDMLYQSAVGDATNWTDDPNDDSSAKSISIGYKDNSHINAVMALYNDLLIFKENFKCFRLSGAYPDWTVAEISKDAYCSNPYSIVQLDNTVMFLGQTGFHGVKTVIQYGDMQTVPLGAKVNSKIQYTLSNDYCSVWYLPFKRQVWIRPNDSGNIWIYSTINGAFTTRKFNSTITDVFSLLDETYVTRGNKVLKIDEKTDLDDGEAFEAKFSPKIYTGYFLVTKVRIDSYTEISARATFNIDRISFPLNLRATGDIAYNDDDIAYTDEDKIIFTSYKTLFQRGVLRTRKIAPTITIHEGIMSIRKIQLTISEVGQ